MLLGNRKEQQTHEQNWCVVLNTIDSEITKKKVARKMSEVFTLSGEEATDLVNNTPIILLDNLSRSIANKVKQYFSAVTRDMLLTNDVLRKRKYYRTVWPEQPNLSFLHNWEPEAAVKTSDEKLNAEEALDELRTAKEEPKKEEAPKAEEVAPAPLPVSSKQVEIPRQVQEELESLRVKTFDAQKLIDTLQNEKEELKTRIAEAEKNQNGHSEESVPSEEVEKLRALLKQSNDRYDVLKEEFRETRELFEERIKQVAADSQGQVGAEQESQITELQKELEALRNENKAMKFGVAQKEEQYAQALKELDSLRQLQESEASQSSADIEEWRTQLAQADQKISMLEKVNADMEKAFEEKTAQADDWRAKYRAIQEELDKINDTYNDLVKYKNQNEQRRLDLENSRSQMIQSLDRYKAKAIRFESQAQSLEKEVETLKEAYSTQEKIVQTNLRHLDMKEEELASLKEKYQKALDEQKNKEDAKRRELLEQRLSDKEIRLRELIKHQQKMEAQIRAQEEEMRAILKDQESIEKDLLSGREEFSNLFGKAPNDPT